MTDEIVIELLRELLEGQRRIEQKLDAMQHRRTPLNQAEQALLCNLLPAIVAKYGGTVFTVRDLLIDPVFSVLLTPLSAVAIGKLFKKAHRQVIAGLRIQVAGREHGSTIWVLEGVEGVEEPTHPTLHKGVSNQTAR